MYHMYYIRVQDLIPWYQEHLQHGMFHVSWKMQIPVW